MKKTLTFLLLTALMVGFVGCEGFNEIINLGAEDGLLVGSDALVKKGETAEILVRFEKVTGTHPFADESLEFVMDGEVYATERTDVSGIARFWYTPDREGDFVFTVRLAKDSQYTARSIEVFVCARDSNTRILVTDIDHTLVDSGGWTVLTGRNEKIKQMKNAAKVLRKFAKEYTIIYLTAREDLLRNKTRDWLAKEKFPAGPMYAWDAHRDQISHREYKTSMIKKFKLDWANVEIGIGDKDSDAWAYNDNNLRHVIIIHPKDDDDENDERKFKAAFPARTVFVKEWKEIQKMLLGDD